MENPKILVIDGDPKNLQILKESLESANFRVVVTGNGNDAWNLIATQRPDIIVSEVDIPGLDGFQLLEKLQQDPVLATIPVVFLTNRRNIEDRIKGLSTGVKDYMVKPLHVKEVIARLQMILRRLEHVRGEEAETTRKVVGRLEENNVETLVESYGVEKRTGILSLYDRHNRNGEIYFRNGSVVNAQLGNFRAEKAVYQMLPWDRGHFIMTFKDVNVDDEITVSNLGLLLQGFKRIQERENLLRQLPSLDTVFVKTAIFEQVLQRKNIGTDALKFVSLFDGKRTLSQVIAESTYDDIKTIERIIRLYEQGFVQPVDGQPFQPRTAPDEPEFKQPQPPQQHKPPANPAFEQRTPPIQRESTDYGEAGVAGRHEHESEQEPEEESSQTQDPDAPFADAEPGHEMTEADSNIYEDMELPSPFSAGGVDSGFDIEQREELPTLDDEFSHSDEEPDFAATPEMKHRELGDRELADETPEEAWQEDSAEQAEQSLPDSFEWQDEPRTEDDRSSTQTEDEANNGQRLMRDASESEIGPTDSDDINAVCDRLFNGNVSKSGKLVVVSGNNWMRKEFVATVTSNTFTTKALGSGANTIELGKLRTAGNRIVEVFGLSTERKLLQLMDEMADDTLAYIFLVVGENSSRLRYLGYLINSIKDKLRVPFVIAVYHPEDKRRVPLDVIRYSLGLEDNEQIVDIDVSSPNSVRHLLGQLRKPRYEQKKV